MVAVFYNAESFRFEAVTTFPHEKFGMVYEDWKARFGDVLEFPDFEPATARHIELAHDPEFVRDMIAGKIRNPVSGYHPCGTTGALWEAGSVLAAARHALATGVPAVAVAAGFHHAGYRKAHAFCTFNGILVAALDLKRAGFSGRFGVLDLDAHFGDGTADIIQRLELHDYVEHYSFAHQLLDPDEVEGWLEGLGGEIEEMHAKGVRLLVYYAGCDPHVSDPMIRGVMTTAQMRRRDRTVFTTCRRLGLPVCWTLGGGYQKPLQKMVELHGLAMEECLAAWMA